MTKLLTQAEMLEVSGGGISLGQIVSALAIGLVTAGPAWLMWIKFMLVYLLHLWLRMQIMRMEWCG